MNKEYKPLNMFIKQTEELKELIKEHPDYPIVVLVGSEVAADDDYRWWYAPELKFKIAEILDCDQDADETRVYSDRDDFKDDLAYKVENSLDINAEYTDEEFDKLVDAEYQKYEKYWRPVIAIYADV